MKTQPITGGQNCPYFYLAAGIQRLFQSMNIFLEKNTQRKKIKITILVTELHCTIHHYVWYLDSLITPDYEHA